MMERVVNESMEHSMFTATTLTLGNQSTQNHAAPTMQKTTKSQSQAGSEVQTCTAESHRLGNSQSWFSRTGESWFSCTGDIGEALCKESVDDDMATASVDDVDPTDSGLSLQCKQICR